MKPRMLTHLSAVVVFGGVCLAAPGSSWAQAPAGPLPAAQPQPPSASASKPQAQQPQIPARTSIFGAWKFNPDESDDARKKMHEARKASDANSGGNQRMGGGWPGGGGGYGGHHGGRSQQSGESDDRERMQELFNPASSLTLAQKDAKGPEIDLTDDQSRRRAFFTDGRKLKKSKDENYQEIAAHWDGNRLVTDEKGARGGKISRSFELSPDGTQLYETLHLTIGRNNIPVTLRYVYEAASQPK